MTRSNRRAPVLHALADTMDGVNRRRNRFADIGMPEPTQSALASSISWVHQDRASMALSLSLPTK
jgi:hypothetical protein